MKAAFNRIRENYALFWLIAGVGLISFTAGVQTTNQAAIAGVAKFEAAVKQQVLAAAQ